MIDTFFYILAWLHIIGDICFVGYWAIRRWPNGPRWQWVWVKTVLPSTVFAWYIAVIR